MKKLISFLLFVICIIPFINAQTQWQRTLGGAGDDKANCIIQANDGGYIISGYTNSFGAGSLDYYIVKLSSSGIPQWTKTIGGNGEEMSLSIIKTSDGGYASCGHIRPAGIEFSDYYIVKLDSGCSLLWNKSINRANNDYALSVIQTNDGGYVLSGISATGGIFSSDMLITKLNSAGNHQWSKTYGGTHDEVAYTIIQTTDGGLAFAGYSNSFGPYNLFNFIKTDIDGNIQWNRLIGESGTGSHIYSIKQTTDGGYVLAGEHTPTGTGDYDMYIVKLNSSGTIQWTRTVRGTGYDMANSIIQTSDGSYLLAGYTNSYGAGSNDMYIVKLNSSGVLQWSKTAGGTGDDQALSIINSADGGFVVAGYTSSFGSGGKDMFIVKFDVSGNTCGNTTSPASISGTSGTATSPAFTVESQNPAVTAPNPVLGSGGILTTLCSNGPPQTPILVSPPNNSFNQSTTIRFIWKRTIDALTYRLQVSLDSLFTNLVVNDSTLTDSTIVVTNMTTNRYYWWRVNAKNPYGTSPYSAVWKFGTFFVGLGPISAETPESFKLYSNYPNPFNPFTKIRFDIPVKDKVIFSVYDLLGKEINTLNERNLSAGLYEYTFDGSNCPSGIYFYRLSCGSFSETRKMVLIK